MPTLARSFAGDPGGPMPNPIDSGPDHDDGSQNVPISDLTGDAGRVGQGLVTSDRRTIHTNPQGPPADADPAPGRVAHHVLTGTIRQWGVGEWDQFNPGTHGEVSPGASVPPGIAMPAVPARGNTFRLQPQPWDNPLFFAQQGAEGSPKV